jgi:hypothetical protein
MDTASVALPQGFPDEGEDGAPTSATTEADGTALDKARMGTV